MTSNDVIFDAMTSLPKVCQILNFKIKATCALLRQGFTSHVVPDKIYDCNDL